MQAGGPHTSDQPRVAVGDERQTESAVEEHDAECIAVTAVRVFHNGGIKDLKRA